MRAVSVAFDKQPIEQVARELGLSQADFAVWGRDKAKIELSALTGPPRGAGRLILVSAINPTPAGEGKTTVAVGLAMAMRRRGARVALCLREPSLGPVFGVKGGGTGGGKATLVPADDINLHFTGDIHAITSANNLLSALVDNALHFRQEIGEKGSLDPRRIRWGRALDMNDRSLRNVVVGLGGANGGAPREERFDITAASEIMAIVALASSHADLAARLGSIFVGETVRKEPVFARELGAEGAMTAVLRDALLPNLVQTVEGGPAIVHCGPFANIAHGCNSILATRMGMHLADYTVTEAGFGFDLGGEKFLDVKCRIGGVFPRALVLVATLRALKMHGGAPVKQAAEPNEDALLGGVEHLQKHLETAAAFGLPVVVAINRFPDDRDDELALVSKRVAAEGATLCLSDVFSRGGEGGLELADAVRRVVDATDAAPPAPRFLYDLDASIPEKIRAIARTVYGADDVAFAGTARADLARIDALGFSKVPVCMAKTHLSLSDDPARPGRPRGFTLTVREVRLSAGAGFAVALTGDLMTMPGLPKVPAAARIKLREDGRVVGLMQNE